MSESWTEWAVVERGFEDDADWHSIVSTAQLLAELAQNRTAGLDSYIIERTMTAGPWQPSDLGVK